MSNQARYGIVWDFDDVIFDTARFKKRIADVLAREGYARAEVLRTVGVAKDVNGYSPEIHGRMLAKSSAEAKRLAALIRRLLRTHGALFVWPDAKRLLATLHAKKVPMYLLSAGNPEFQKLKINTSSLKTYFKKIELVRITELDSAGKTKVRVVKKFLKDHSPLLFLDDRPKNIAAIENESAFKKNIIPVLIRHPGAKLTLAALRKVIQGADF